MRNSVWEAGFLRVSTAAGACSLCSLGSLAGYKILVGVSVRDRASSSNQRVHVILGLEAVGRETKLPRNPNQKPQESRGRSQRCLLELYALSKVKDELRLTLLSLIRTRWLMHRMPALRRQEVK